MESKFFLYANKDNCLYLSDEVEESCKKWLEEKIETHFPKVSEVENISVDDFNKNYRANNKPVILRGLANHWKAREKWTFDYFKNNYGQKTVPINLYSKSENIQLLEFIEQLYKNKTNASSTPLYLQEWHFLADCPDLQNDIEILPHFKDDWNYRIFGYYNFGLWMGLKGSITRFHQDSAYINTFHVQVTGQKRWFLFGPSACLKQDKSGALNFNDFLVDPTTTPMSCQLNPGDVMYIPSLWWHRVVTDEDAISLNVTHITDQLLPQFINASAGPMVALILNRELLKNKHQAIYNTSYERVLTHAKLMNLNIDNILGLDVKK
jgi:hypothetical protein